MVATIRLRLPARLEAARLARDALAELKLASNQLEDLLLLVSELVSWCVLHSGESSGDLELCVALEERRVRALVRGQIVGGAGSRPALATTRRTLLDRLTQRWGLIEDGAGGAWVELRRDLAVEHAEHREALRERNVVVHERAAAVHMRAARFHEEMAAACRARGQESRADAEARRAESAHHRCQAELFRSRRTLASQ